MKRILRLMAVVVVGAVLAGCGATNTGNSGAPNFQLRMYKVPAAQSKAIAGNLEGILASPQFLIGRTGHTTMRATTPFPGTVLVLAPASVQPSIASAVAELAKAAEIAGPAKPAKPASPVAVPLRVQFWVVQAEAGTGSDSATLQPLAKTLDALRGSLGPSHFVQEDAAALHVSILNDGDDSDGIGQVTSARGHEYRVHANILDDGKISLEIKYSNTTKNAADLSIPALMTTVVATPGDYVVLAEALPPADASTGAHAALMNLLVVRVDQVGAAKH